MRIKVVLVVALAFALPWLLLAALSPRAIYDAVLNTGWQVAGFDLKRIEVDGETIAYLEGGAGPPLVVVPGFGDDSRTWLEVARTLGGSHRVLIPDPPGFGRSPADVDAGYTFPEQVQRLEGLLNATGIRETALLGESMGGGVVAYHAATHPDRVTRLTLLCPAGVEPAKLSPFWQEVRRGTNLLIPQTDRELQIAMRTIMADPPRLPRYVRRLLLAEIEKQTALRKRLFRELRSGGDHQVQPLLPRITTPTLVLWGDQDLVLDPSGARAVARDLPAAEMKVLPGCGHTLHVDCPDRVVEYHLAHADRM